MEFWATQSLVWLVASTVHLYFVYLVLNRIPELEGVSGDDGFIRCNESTNGWEPLTSLGSRFLFSHTVLVLVNIIKFERCFLSVPFRL